MLVGKQLANLYLWAPTTHQQHMQHSIGLGLSDKFDAKCKKRIKSADLFDTKKKNKFTLKYHEAFMLQELLINAVPHLTNQFHKTLANKLIATLNKQLIC